MAALTPRTPRLNSVNLNMLCPLSQKSFQELFGKHPTGRKSYVVAVVGEHYYDAFAWHRRLFEGCFKDFENVQYVAVRKPDDCVAWKLSAGAEGYFVTSGSDVEAMRTSLAWTIVLFKQMAVQSGDVERLKNIQAEIVTHLPRNFFYDAASAEAILSMIVRINSHCTPALLRLGLLYHNGGKGPQDKAKEIFQQLVAPAKTYEAKKTSFPLHRKSQSQSLPLLPSMTDEQTKQDQREDQKAWHKVASNLSPRDASPRGTISIAFHLTPRSDKKIAFDILKKIEELDMTDTAMLALLGICFKDNDLVAALLRETIEKARFSDLLKATLRLNDEGDELDLPDGLAVDPLDVELLHLSIQKLQAAFSEKRDLFIETLLVNLYLKGPQPDLEKGEDMVTEILRKNISSCFALTARARLSRGRKNLEAAVKDYRAVIRLSGNIAVMEELAELFCSGLDVAEGLKLCEEILRQDPSRKKAYQKLIELFQLNEKIEEAKALCLKHLDDDFALGRLGALCADDDPMKESYFMRALAKNPDDPFVLGHYGFFLLNQAEPSEVHRKEAFKMLQKAHELDPNNVQALSGLAIIHKQGIPDVVKKDRPRSRSLLEKASSIAPRSAHVRKASLSSSIPRASEEHKEYEALRKRASSADMAPPLKNKDEAKLNAKEVYEENRTDIFSIVAYIDVLEDEAEKAKVLQEAFKQHQENVTFLERLIPFALSTPASLRELFNVDLENRHFIFQKLRLLGSHHPSFCDFAYRLADLCWPVKNRFSWPQEVEQPGTRLPKMALELYQMILEVKPGELSAKSYIGDLLATGAEGVGQDRERARTFFEACLAKQAHHIFSLLALAELDLAEGVRRHDLYRLVLAIEPKQPLALARLRGE